MSNDIEAELSLKDEQTMFFAAMRDHFGIVGQVLDADILAKYAERYTGWLMAKRAALAAPQTVAAWRGLWDTQWMNIVNHDHAYQDYSKDDAVHLAVKMTENKLKENNMLTAAPVLNDEATMRVVVDALKFYADGHHFALADADAWDTVSGEPQNFQCDEAGTATVEDGTLAKMALAELSGENKNYSAMLAAGDSDA